MSVAVRAYQQQEVGFWAPAGATAAESSVSLDTSRQFDVLDGLASLVPQVPLDAPTIMSIVMVAAFVVQLYWSLISLSLSQAAVASSSSSSSVSSATTTTTAVPYAPPVVAAAAAAQPVTVSIPQRQTVTPAPPPEWRFFMRHPGQLHWLGKRSSDSVKQSDMEYLKNWNFYLPKHSQAQSFENYNPKQSQEQYLDTVHQDGGVTPGGQTWYHTRPRMSLQYGTGEGGAGWHVGDVREFEDLKELQEFLGEPLSSHRLVNLPQEQEEPMEEGKTTAGVAASLLYNAERWGHRLEDWNLLSPDGAQLLTHTILMMRCAVLNQDYCAKLDHYFRRQQDLNLVAAMMNHQEEEDHQDHDADHDYQDYGNQEWPPQPDTSTSSAGIDRGPGRPYNTDTPWDKDQQGENSAQERQQQQQKHKHKKRVWTGDLENNKGNSSSNSSRKYWNIYVFMSVMAVLVFLMDASYRILRAVTTTTTTSEGRSASPHDPHHQHLMDTLSAALTRWGHRNYHTRL